jgi:opacity protein-like surface antigen
MRTLRFGISLAAVLAVAPAAFAADLAVKAPVAAPTTPAYPYSVAGAYWGVTAYASQTSLDVNAPGSNTGNVTAVGGSAGLLAGWSMPVNGGANFARFEASAAAQNIGTSAAQANGVLSFKGPWRIEGVAEYGMPCANIAAYFPNVGNILPTLPAIPSGLTATNCHAYAGLGAAAEDISATLNMNTGGSVSQGSEWSASMIGKFGQIWQLTNGSAVETWIEYETNGKSFSLDSGGPKATPSIQGQDHKILLGVNYLL